MDSNWKHILIKITKLRGRLSVYVHKASKFVTILYILFFQKCIFCKQCHRTFKKGTRLKNLSNRRSEKLGGFWMTDTNKFKTSCISQSGFPKDSIVQSAVAAWVMRSLGLISGLRQDFFTRAPCKNLFLFIKFFDEIYLWYTHTYTRTGRSPFHLLKPTHVWI